MIRLATAFLVGLLIIPGAYILTKPSVTVYHQIEETTPADEEPSLPTAPDIPEPQPVPKDLDPEPPLPEGVYCMDDCPLIDPETVFNDGVKDYVVEYFEDKPVMISIAKCESQFRQWDPETGDVLKNHQGSSAVGVMQIMRSYHEGPAADMGHNIEELEGNVAYADYLYETQGTQPWEASISCWGQYARKETDGGTL